LWWTKWHWHRFLSKYFGIFPVSIIPQCSTLTHPSHSPHGLISGTARQKITHLKVTESNLKVTKMAWEKKLPAYLYVIATAVWRELNKTSDSSLKII
jgi:hypothetical protein